MLKPGLMMKQEMLLSSILVHAERFYGWQEVVGRRVEGDLHRITFKAMAARARQLANALHALNIQQGENIGTIAWNSHRHIEIYYAVAGMGAVTHTLNPRYTPQQLIYIINYAQDTTIFFDLPFSPLIKAIALHCPSVKTWIFLLVEDKIPAEPPLVALLNYEVLL